MSAGRAFRAAAAALALLAAIGCGYALSGTGRGALPENVKSGYVSSCGTDTSRVGLEQRLTDAVLRELSARARLKPASDRSAADAELAGRIVSYEAVPVRFDNAGRALEYQITVVAKVTLTIPGPGSDAPIVN